VPTKARAVEIIREFVSSRYPDRAKHVEPGGTLDPDKFPCLQIGNEARWRENRDGTFTVIIRGNDVPLSDESVQWLVDQGYLESN
jgi:hypothetical protein